MIHRTFEECCTDFKKLSVNYLAQDNSSKRKFLFFRSASNDITIVNELFGIVHKVTFTMCFPFISHVSKISFLKNLATIHKKLLNLVNMSNANNNIINFYKNFTAVLKNTCYILFSGSFCHPDMINLYYISYYLDCAESGFDCPKNNEILKEEVLGLLKQYIDYQKSWMGVNLVKLVFDTIIQDEKSINLYTESNDGRFINILKFLNPLRLILAKFNDKRLFPEITMVMHRALEIINPDMKSNTASGLSSMDFEDIITQKLLILEGKVIALRMPMLILKQMTNPKLKLITQDSIVKFCNDPVSNKIYYTAL
jgi:hypothetical protein